MYHFLLLYLVFSDVLGINQDPAMDDGSAW